MSALPSRKIVRANRLPQAPEAIIRRFVCGKKMKAPISALLKD